MVSLVPLRYRLVITVKAYQLVPDRFVEYCGFTLQAFVPVERKTTLLPKEMLRSRILGGGGGGGGATVRIVPPNPWM